MKEELGISNFTDYLSNDEKIFGVMVGVVVKNDPSKDDSKPGPGRVKVKIPLIGMKESNWARIASFMAGKEMGAFFLPEEGDEVLVAFENGDVNRPFVIGSLWNGKDAPPETNSDGKNNIRLIKSRSGHIIKFGDKEGEEQIQIVDKSGKNKIIIDTKGNKVTISSGKDIEISAPDGKLAIAAKEIEMKSSAATKIEASAKMTIKGATVEIN